MYQELCESKRTTMDIFHKEPQKIDGLLGPKSGSYKSMVGWLYGRQPNILIPLIKEQTRTDPARLLTAGSMLVPLYRGVRKPMNHVFSTNSLWWRRKCYSNTAIAEGEMQHNTGMSGEAGKMNKQVRQWTCVYMYLYNRCVFDKKTCIIWIVQIRVLYRILQQIHRITWIYIYLVMWNRNS